MTLYSPLLYAFKPSLVMTVHLNAVKLHNFVCLIVCVCTSLEPFFVAMETVLVICFLKPVFVNLFDAIILFYIINLIYSIHFADFRYTDSTFTFIYAKGSTRYDIYHFTSLHFSHKTLFSHFGTWFA